MITRRSFLASVPPAITGSAVALPTVAEPSPETPAAKVTRLRRELLEATQAFYPEVTDWRVIMPESPHCGDNDLTVGMFLVAGHPPRKAARS